MAVITCNVIHLGLTDYQRGLEIQRAMVGQIRSGQQPNTLLLLEHHHVYTIGRRGSRQDVFLDDEALEASGIQLHEADRGGQVTYHGPGQLVAYPLVDLREWGGPLKYVRALEQVMVRTLAGFDIQAGVVEGNTGVWVGSEKIGAIGVKISRGVSYHGLALNVNTDLDFFRHIIPCGIAGAQVTSIARLLGGPVDLQLVAYGLTYHFGRAMGFRMVAGQSLLADLALTATASPLG